VPTIGIFPDFWFLYGHGQNGLHSALNLLNVLSPINFSKAEIAFPAKSWRRTAKKFSNPKKLCDEARCVNPNLRGRTPTAFKESISAGERWKSWLRTARPHFPMLILFAGCLDPATPDYFFTFF